MRRLTLITVVLLATIIPTRAQEKAGAFDASDFTDAMKRDAVFTTSKCSTCHSMRRVVKSDYEPGEWRDVVDRMRKMEKSGISRGDADRITRFLDLRATPAEQRGKSAGTAPAPDKAAEVAPAAPGSGALAEACTAAGPGEVEIAGSAVTLVATPADAPWTVTLSGREARLEAGRPLTLARWSFGRFAFSLELRLERTNPARLTAWVVGPQGPRAGVAPPVTRINRPVTPSKETMTCPVHSPSR